MTRLRHPTLLAAPLLILLGATAGAQLRTLETDDLRLVYFEPTLNYLAPHAARCFEGSMAFQSEVFGFAPKGKVTVLLKDFSDRGNAAAGAIPRNALLFDIAPMDFTFENFVAGERMYMLMNHELVHVATMDETAARDRFFRTLFAGKVTPDAEHPETILYNYLTAPRVTVPRWYLEGVAVFAETWMAGGIGRAQGSYDEMVFRAMVRDDSRFYDPLGLVAEGTKIDFQVEANSYLYGTRFLSYLAYHYSPEDVVRWVARREGSRPGYRAQFREVFGVSLDEAWQDWITFEHDFQEANLARIRAYPLTEYRDLSPKALGSVSRAAYDPATDTLYAGLFYPGVVSHIGAISLADGSIEKLLDIKGPALFSVTSVALDPTTRTLFYTTDHNALRDLMALDLDSGKSKALIRDGRIGDLAFNPADRSLWGIRHLNGIATVVRMPPPYDGWNQVRSWPYGPVIYDLDVSPDGALVSVSVAEVSGQHVLRVYRVEDLGQEPLVAYRELDFGTAIPSGFNFSPDGAWLYGSSYYSGVSNVFRYRLEDRELEAISNTDSGFFRPIPRADGSVIVFRYTGDGFVPATIRAEPIEDVNPILFLGQQTIAKHPELEKWRVGSPAAVPLEERITHEGSYRSFRSIGVESLYPVLEGYKDSAAAGLRLNLSDPLSLNRLHLVASYSPDRDLADDERLHLELGFERYNWRASAKLNDADFYDLFGPTKRSLKGYSLGVGYDKLLLYDRPRELKLSFDTAFYGDLERLPDYQNVAVAFDQLIHSEVVLHYQNLRSSLGHVDDEKGFQGRLVAANNLVEGHSTPSLRVEYDVGFALPIAHSSLWLRSAAGTGFGDRDDPFANFFFGGFGNNWVDRGSVQRYREFYAFPGLDLNQVGGRSFVKSIVEWSLPPIRFRRVGWPGFYLTWARPALFVGGLVTNPDAGDLRQTVSDIGAQVDLRFNLMSSVDMTLSLGYAVARESAGTSRDELMVSLRILGD